MTENNNGYKVAKDEERDKSREHWEKKLEALEGLVIKKVRYMTDEEIEKFDFFYAGVVLELDDGTLIWPTMDDDGSDAGALQIQVGEKSKGHGLPALAPTVAVTWEEVGDRHAVA